MYTLLTYYETFSNGYTTKALTAIDIFCVLCSILVITSKNPIVSVLFLIALFMGIASHLMILGMTFIGLSYILVYIGAVSILFLFILMLINIRISELVNDTKNTIPLAFIIALAFNYPLSFVSLPLHDMMGWKDKLLSVIKGSLGFTEYNILDLYRNLPTLQAIFIEHQNFWFSSFNVWDGALQEVSHITSIGNIMYTNFAVLLIFASIILLLAMVGTIIITKKDPE